MNNNGVNNNNVNTNVGPVIVPIDNAQPTQQPVQQTQVQQVQPVQPATPSQPVPAAPAPQPTPTTEAPTQPQTTKEGIPLNHPQMIINAADVKLEEPKVEEQPTTEPKIENNEVKKEVPTATNKKSLTVPILIFIIVGLLIYTFTSFKSHAEQIKKITYSCTPVASSKEETKLDINSTLVKDLYSKVVTTIREDVAQPMNSSNPETRKKQQETMNLYLAYRQVKDKDKYDSNCAYFDNVSMEPYKCEDTVNFKPKAFKKETFELEYKKLFGEKTELKLANIKLQYGCIGGYEYIADREEFVQGKCDSETATSFKVTKTIEEATTTKNMIIIKESVKYHENEKMKLPDYLVSGTYYYTFRLDMNYNWIFISKKYESKY